jgi:hypothetical protein
VGAGRKGTGYIGPCQVRDLQEKNLFLTILSIILFFKHKMPSVEHLKSLVTMNYCYGRFQQKHELK